MNLVMLYYTKVKHPFLGKTYLSVNKLEIEANKFAVNLLISDEDLKEYKELTTGQLAMIMDFMKNCIN